VERNIDRWWKMPCPKSCRCVNPKFTDDTISIGSIPTSKVTSIDRTKDGAISIKVLSFAQFMTGDKLSMTAGQKGVAHIVEYEDLPMIVMKDGSSFNADLYMAVGSIVPRQTNGMIVESGMAMRAAMQGKKMTVGYADDGEFEECQYIINPITGMPMTCRFEQGGSECLMKATIGIVRVINQTQMTRERHHLTHNSEGKTSLGTAPGRASGGGVAAAEMDFHAMFSSGLIGCAQELFERGNVVRVPFCMRCNRIIPYKDHAGLCSGHIVRVRMSYDVATLDSMSAAINGSTNIYDVEHV
jgi:RNA polymerase Rpb2, domain 6